MVSKGKYDQELAILFKVDRSTILYHRRRHNIPANRSPGYPKGQKNFKNRKKVSEPHKPPKPVPYAEKVNEGKTRYKEYVKAEKDRLSTGKG